MKNLIDIEQTFCKEIKGVPYTGIFPKVGKEAERKTVFILHYTVIDINYREGIVTMKDGSGAIHYAVFQTEGNDKGLFCYATKEENTGRLISWHQKFVYYNRGHIVTFLE